MLLVSWNVNGLRACLNKGFLDFFHAVSADVFCVQETKLQDGQLDLALPDYRQYWNHAEKKGYSGTAVFSRAEPLSLRGGIGVPEHDREGRVLTLEYEDFYLVCVYSPNSQDGLRRLPYRMEWEDAFLAHLRALDGRKAVVVCGDFNVAHREIDLKNPKSNTANPGFTPEERGKFGGLLEAGFTDSFRHLYPDRRDAYTWWSYRSFARERNTGWRIDYFLTSNRLAPRIRDSVIYADVQGSDHCPVGLVLE